MMQILAILFADGAVARTQRTLEDQFELVHQEALMSQKNGDPEDAARANVLRTAADAINTELNIYRLTPERRFFYLFGVRIQTVLGSVASVVVAQGLAYAWSTSWCSVAIALIATAITSTFRKQPWTG